ncbi:hypothetical protein [Gordoniibacillus kamchatkensis]|nr:hypothetical protein [Paenibacillus sp. VKM B-2647]
MNSNHLLCSLPQPPKTLDDFQRNDQPSAIAKQKPDLPGDLDRKRQA